MAKSELDSLESQIDGFIGSFQQLTLENTSLRKKIANLNHECAKLLDNKKKTTTSIRKIVIQLQNKLLCQTKKK